MNNTEIFQLGLGLVNPFKVISVEFQTGSMLSRVVKDNK
jgi:hypothetical protein